MAVRILLVGVMAYLIGNLNFSIILTKIFYNRDIRRYGSGNAGTTNTMRVFGFLSGALVLLLDLAKGAGAVYLSYCLLPAQSRVFVGLFAGFLAALGHVYPVIFRFHGGKGVATIMGAMLALDWRIFLCAAAILFAVLLISRYMSLASMVAASALPLLLFLFSYFIYRSALSVSLLTLLLTLPFSALVLFTHRSNIQRLRAGNENKFSITFHEGGASK